MSAYTVQNVFDNFALTYKGVPQPMQFLLLNEVDMTVSRYFGIRKKTLYLALTVNATEYALDDTILWIEEARYVDQPSSDTTAQGGYVLGESNIDELDTSYIDWRANSSSQPCVALMSANTSGGTMRFDAPSYASTLTVTNATNATPVVITSSAAHGLADGDRADIVLVGGNTAANGPWYAKETGYTTNTFALYQDSALTIPVVGNGSYTSSTGLISCSSSPLVQIYARVRQNFSTTSDSLPDMPTYVRLYSEGMKWLYAKDRMLPEAATYAAFWNKTMEDQIKLTQLRGGRKPFKLQQLSIRPYPSVWRPPW